MLSEYKYLPRVLNTAVSPFKTILNDVSNK
nr:MAG TPA: hypothetical protein [Caudoviricetes sp.]